MTIQSARRKTATLLAIATVALSACGTFSIKPPIVGYTCCNLRAHSGWVSSQNIQSGAIIPAGEPVVLDSIKKRFYMYGTVGGTATGLRDDNAKTEADTLRWAKTIVISESPRDLIRSWPDDVRLAVQYSKVKAGMTKAQVLASIGYPPASETPSTDAAVWRYWSGIDDLPVELHFDNRGQLTRVLGASAAVRSMSSDR